MNQKFKLALTAICTLLCALSLSNPTHAQDLPDGPGKAEFVHNCTACHRADMVTAVKKTPPDWKKSVAEMAARGTDGTPEDLDKVVAYLVKNYSTGNPAPTHPAADADRAKRLITDNGCLACHRIEKQGGAIAPSLNGVGKRHTADEIREAIINPKKPMPSYQEKIKGDDLDVLIRYLDSLPPADEGVQK